MDMTTTGLVMKTSKYGVGPSAPRMGHSFVDFCLRFEQVDSVVCLRDRLALLVSDRFTPCVCLSRTPKGRLMAALDGADGGASCARRRRERRLRAFWKHELFAVRCAVATATHHSANKASARRRRDPNIIIIRAPAQGPSQHASVSSHSHPKLLIRTDNVARIKKSSSSSTSTSWLKFSSPLVLPVTHGSIVCPQGQGGGGSRRPPRGREGLRAFPEGCRLLGDRGGH